MGISNWNLSIFAKFTWLLCKNIKNRSLEQNNNIILFSALDWGLGHTTRSIPILSYYQRLGYNLLIACEPNTGSATILKSHFPQANYLALKGYNISYAKSRKTFAFKIFLQIPRILRSIYKEHKFVKNIVRKYPLKLIISDNRYGFYHKKVKSIFITHQLAIEIPQPWLKRIVQRINYQHINHFAACWVPDIEKTPNIAGHLSHPSRLPKTPVRYMGPLSRLSPIEYPVDPGVPDRKKYKYTFLFLLSGPEPQRSLLEQNIINAGFKLKAPAILVRGLPNSGEANLESILSPRQQADSPSNPLEIQAYADPAHLRQLIADAEFVVCRSGYSTVMDLVLLQKKAIYIPTPGQTEQEFLAEKLYAQHWAYYFNQSAPDYNTCLDRARHFAYQLPKIPRSDLEGFLNKFGQP